MSEDNIKKSEKDLVVEQTKTDSKETEFVDIKKLLESQTDCV
jgi:hypothetical protein